MKLVPLATNFIELHRVTPGILSVSKSNFASTNGAC
jgi:hypothetical protein